MGVLHLLKSVPNFIELVKQQILLTIFLLSKMTRIPNQSQMVHEQFVVLKQLYGN